VRDPEQPSVELRIAPKFIKRVPRLNKYLLRDVVGVVVVNDDFAHHPVHALLVRAHDLVEGVPTGVGIAIKF